MSAANERDIVFAIHYMETKQTRREKPIQQKQKAGIVTSLKDTTLTKVTYGKYATRVPDEVAYGIYEWFSSQQNTLLHIINIYIPRSKRSNSMNATKASPNVFVGSVIQSSLCTFRGQCQFARTVTAPFRSIRHRVQ